MCLRQVCLRQVYHDRSTSCQSTSHTFMVLNIKKMARIQSKAIQCPVSAAYKMKYLRYSEYQYQSDTLHQIGRSFFIILHFWACNDFECVVPCSFLDSSFFLLYNNKDVNLTFQLHSTIMDQQPDVIIAQV